MARLRTSDVMLKFDQARQQSDDLCCPLHSSSKVWQQRSPPRPDLWETLTQDHLAGGHQVSVAAVLDFHAFVSCYTLFN
jgi:hypothetical protein